jgi:NAD(P)H dehydrogenase (quinone)
MSGVIAVTGATGVVGGRVAARLAAAGVPMRLLVRDPSRAPRHPGAEVRRIGGYGAAGDVRAALEGAATLFLLPAEESADRVEQHRTAIEAAAAAGVRRIVYLSFVGAAPDATFTLVRDHWATEEIVRATGLAQTFVRMNLYMDFLPAMVAPDGALRGPAGDGRVAAILREDVAAGVAAVLGTEGHDGRTYDLTGPSAFSLAEAAAAMTRVTGRPVRYEDETDEEAYASRAGYGAPDWQVEAWVTTYHAIRDGSLAAVSPDLRMLTGRSATSLEAHLRSAAAG